MRLSGIHLLLTYKCNASCGHCFLSCGPSKGGLMKLEQVRHYLDQADKMKRGAYFFVEGGEPFLYQAQLRDFISLIRGRGYWVGALSNGFWATSRVRATKVLSPLVESGLSTLGISSDDYHEEFVPRKVARRASRVAQDLGLEGSILSCGPADLACKGRAAAATDQCNLSGVLKPEECVKCEERLDDPSRIHVGPSGEIHLCQGLLLGESADERSLPEIFENFNAAAHPIVEPLLRGGPAELARWAAESGFTPGRQLYFDSCQLCYEVRAHLRKRYPRYLGPSHVY